MERKNDTVRFLASPKSGTIVRLDIRFPLSFFVTVALSPTLLLQNRFDVDVSAAYEI